MYLDSPLQDPPKFTQNWEFWFEIKPYGNPGLGESPNRNDFSKENTNQGFKNALYMIKDVFFLPIAIIQLSRISLNWPQFLLSMEEQKLFMIIVSARVRISTIRSY
jgi:hypothetical protein